MWNKYSDELFVYPHRKSYKCVYNIFCDTFMPPFIYLAAVDQFREHGKTNTYVIVTPSFLSSNELLQVKKYVCVIKGLKVPKNFHQFREKDKTWLLIPDN